MSNVRFLDQVSVASFQASTARSSTSAAALPAVILPGETYTISANTVQSTYNLTILGTLKLELGSEVEAPGGGVIRTDAQLWVENILDNQGTIINEGLIQIGNS